MLPQGHPFQNVQAKPYWTSTTYVSLNTMARLVEFSYGYVANSPKGNPFPVWCVRGGQGPDAH